MSEQRYTYQVDFEYVIRWLIDWFWISDFEYLMWHDCHPYISLLTLPVLGNVMISNWCTKQTIHRCAIAPCKTLKGYQSRLQRVIKKRLTSHYVTTNHLFLPFKLVLMLLCEDDLNYERHNNCSKPLNSLFSWLNNHLSPVTICHGDVIHLMC